MQAQGDLSFFRSRQRLKELCFYTFLIPLKFRQVMLLPGFSVYQSGADLCRNGYSAGLLQYDQTLGVSYDLAAVCFYFQNFFGSLFLQEQAET